MKRVRYFIKSLSGILLFIIILFVSAGRIDYHQGRIFGGMSLLGALMSFILTGNDTELMDERATISKDAKKWDLQILKFSAMTAIVAYIIAGLDSGRYQWSPRFHWSIVATGVVIMFLGQSLFVIAKMTNRFFSGVMRIQQDRGHTVCDSGIYRFVRHPGYSGMILSWAGFPLLLGSVWSGIPVLFSIVLLLIRTSLEDKSLMSELPGYGEYAHKTRYRLVPGIW